MAAYRHRAAVSCRDAGHPADSRVCRSLEGRLAAVPGFAFRPRSLVGNQINPDNRRDCRPRQCGFGRGDGMAFDPLRLPRQAIADHAARFAVFRIARGGRFDVRFVIRRAHGIGRLAGSARHPNHFRRSGHYSGNPVRYLPLCRARNHPADAGEFGAVSVVSGHIRGETNTIPLLVEIFYNEYNFVGAFALSSILALLAIATLAIQDILTKIQQKKHRAAEREAA